VGGRQTHAVLPHLIDTEQLGPQRRLVAKGLPAAPLAPTRALVRRVLSWRQCLRRFELPAFIADPTLFSKRLGDRL